MGLTRYFGGLTAKFDDFPPDFYGMELPRVGAFTDFGGSRYRNPVHFLGYFSDFTLISEFSGLVYYTGGFSGDTVELRSKLWKSGLLEAGEMHLRFTGDCGVFIRGFNI